MSTTNLHTIIDQAINDIALPAEPAGLYEPITYTMSCGGKRLRPTLLLATVEALGADIAGAIPLAQGIEMFHNFTLLHDDVMDNADVRRGRPTVHRRWNTNTAILSGDAMLTLANELIGKCPDSCLRPALELFNRTAMEVYEGQQLDMDFETRQDVTVDQYMEMIRLKTSVLLACACELGAIYSGATPGICRAFYQFGEALGLAFQLQDDLLDTFGDPVIFGKQTGGDILNNKKTWLLITACAEDKSGVMDKALREYWHGDEKIENVRNVYRTLELDKRIGTLISEYSDKALVALSKTGLSTERLAFFTDLTHSLQKRTF